MALVVQKYGGTSVGSVERIQAVAQRVKRTVDAGNSVVVVVSAMGKTTDGLVQLATEISANQSRRENERPAPLAARPNQIARGSAARRDASPSAPRASDRRSPPGAACRE